MKTIDDLYNESKRLRDNRASRDILEEKIETLFDNNTIDHNQYSTFLNLIDDTYSKAYNRGDEEQAEAHREDAISETKANISRDLFNILDSFELPKPGDKSKYAELFKKIYIFSIINIQDSALLTQGLESIGTLGIIK